MKKNTNVIACGCAVVSVTDGKMTTSIDRLAKGVNRLFAHVHNRQA